MWNYKLEEYFSYAPCPCASQPCGGASDPRNDEVKFPSNFSVELPYLQPLYFNWPARNTLALALASS
jgi:hypothetical protein